MESQRPQKSEENYFWENVAREQYVADRFSQVYEGLSPSGPRAGAGRQDERAG